MTGLFFRNNLKEGELFILPTDKVSTDVLLSRYLANLLGLKVGDSFLTYFVQDEVRARKFRIRVFMRRVLLIMTSCL